LRVRRIRALAAAQAALTTARILAERVRQHPGVRMVGAERRAQDSVGATTKWAA
jgi:hypothetical protein